jgi:hypothetical protein
MKYFFRYNNNVSIVQSILHNFLCVRFFLHTFLDAVAANAMLIQYKQDVNKMTVIQIASLYAIFVYDSNHGGDYVVILDELCNVVIIIIFHTA